MIAALPIGIAAIFAHIQHGSAISHCPLKEGISLKKSTRGKYERRSKPNILLLLLCLLLLGIAIFSGYKVVTISLEYRKGEQTYEELQQYIQLPDLTPVSTEPSEDTESKPISGHTPSETLPSDHSGLESENAFVSPVDFEALWQINPDVVGWIYIPETSINYPVVQGETNNTYLYHLFNGEYNRSGSIFMDFRNAVDYSDTNTILYGHHMGDGTMFADIVKYKKQSFYNAHPKGYLFTPDRTFELTFFTAYVTDMTDDAWRMQFSSEEDYADWLRDSAARSEFHAGLLPTLTDQLLTLSTCTYEFDDARFVLVATMK